MKPAEFLALSDKFRASLEKRCEQDKLFYKFLGVMNPMEPQRMYFIVGDEVYSLYNDGDQAAWKYEGKVRNV